VAIQLPRLVALGAAVEAGDHVWPLRLCQKPIVGLATVDGRREGGIDSAMVRRCW